MNEIAFGPLLYRPGDWRNLGYVADGFYTESDFDETGALRSDVVSIKGVTSHVGTSSIKT